MTHSPIAPDQHLSILIVDNDRGRDPVYETFFERLEASPDFGVTVELLLPRTPSQALEYLRAKRAHMVLLDIMLNSDEWAAQASAVRQAISASGLPLGLLSGGFGTPEYDEITLEILRVFVSSPKLGLFPYAASIESHFFDVNGVRNQTTELPKRLADYWKLIYMMVTFPGANLSWQPKTKGEITFLHLTDTHFGDSVSDYLDAKGIYSGAKKAGLTPDMLVWTGDITNRGMPGEFAAAAAFFQNLKEARVLSSACPVSLAPGNHDLCWPLALASRLQFVEEKVDEASAGIPNATKSGQGSWKVQKESVASGLWEFGFQPYRDFFQNIVGEAAPTVAQGFRWQPQWRHLGIAILEIPLEEHIVRSNTKDSDPAPFVSEDVFNGITNASLKSIEASELDKRVCIVVLLHGRNPNKESTLVKQWNRLMSGIAAMGHPVIVPAGHEHQLAIAPNARRLTIVGTPHHEKHTNDSPSLPGVGIIQLRHLLTNEVECGYSKIEKGPNEKGETVWEARSTVWHRLNKDAPYHWIEFIRG